MKKIFLLSLFFYIPFLTFNVNNDKGKVMKAKSSIEKIKKINEKFTEKDKEEIVKNYENLKIAMIKKDMKALREILPEDFKAVHITGKVQSREEWLSDIENNEMNYYEFSNIHYEFIEKEEEIILKVDQIIHAKIYGIEGKWRIPGERVFKKVFNQWKIIK